MIELLLKPIMVSLYCRLPHGLLFRAETEYELMQSFWGHASDDRPTQIRQALDLVNLDLLVGDMLDEPPA